MNKSTNKTTIEPHFNKMLSMAEEYFASNKLEKYEYHQCLVLNTADGEDKIYFFYSDSVEELVSKCCSILSQEKITTIKRIVCMFEDGSITTPAYQFMKNLCALNKENRKAEVLLMTLKGTYGIKQINDIIGCFLSDV